MFSRLAQLRYSSSNRCDLPCRSSGFAVFSFLLFACSSAPFVISKDFTYTDDYPGLLSVLGALLGIILRWVPILPPKFGILRKESSLVRSGLVEVGSVGTSAIETIENPIRPPEALTAMSHILRISTVAYNSVRTVTPKTYLTFRPRLLALIEDRANRVTYWCT